MDLVGFDFPVLELFSSVLDCDTVGSIVVFGFCFCIVSSNVDSYPSVISSLNTSRNGSSPKPERTCEVLILLFRRDPATFFFI